jgi:type II secretory pathway pseudopilin PulG
MKARMKRPDLRGFTFVELLVTAAVAALVFGGLMASVQFAVKLISEAKAKTGAVSLANERLEYIRSLSYADIGTVGGIPAGPIPQNATTTLNAITYYERVLIQYVDAPEDGLGASDTNGIVADYKRAKVEYSWLGQNGTSSIFLISDIAPPGIESTAGGGTLVVNVFDADVTPVAGAAVRVMNDTTSSAIDTTQYTNVNGVAFFAGAPAAAQYRLSVTKPGYSTDGTYVATTSNPDPVTPPAAVIEGAVSTMNFQIDELSTLSVRTIEPPSIGVMHDDFDDTSMITDLFDAAVTGGDLVLAGAAGSYATAGSALSASATPTTITAWDRATWDATTTLNTTLAVRVYTVSDGSYALVPDTDLPGNSTGFTSGDVSLAGLDPDTYPSLALGASLGTLDPSQTPVLHAWEISYTIDEPPISGVPFTLQSTKVIGTTPVYKYEESHTTGGDGVAVIPDLEWDSYKVSLSTGSYDISEACPALPFPLEPGVERTLTLTLMPNATRSMRVSVVDASGEPIANASVELERSGFNESEDTSSCGQSFFNTGLMSATDYVINVSAAGYTDRSVTGITIDDDETLVVPLTSS